MIAISTDQTCSTWSLQPLSETHLLLLGNNLLGGINQLPIFFLNISFIANSDEK